MSQRFLPQPSRVLPVLMAVVLVFPCLARADEKDEVIEKLKQELKLRQQQFEKQQQILEKQAELTAQLVQEMKARDELLKKAEAKVADLTKQVNDLRDQLVAAKIESRIPKERAAGLFAQLEAAQKELERLKRGEEKKPDRPAPKPPPELIEGAIQRVEEKAGLVTISIGSDSGLQDGHTLEVYRLQPTPQYLGTIKILKVSPKDAVAQVVGRPLGLLQVGDKVSNRIKPGQ